MWLALLVLVPGCTRSAPAPSDRELYLRSLEASPAEARELCGAITEAELRSECRSEAADRAVAAGELETARLLCVETDVGRWKDECFFRISDAIELVGREAQEFCLQAGRFRTDCVAHALFRELLAATDLPAEEGRENELGAALARRVASHDLPERKAEELVSSILAHRIAQRIGDPFDAARCGQADVELCAMAYLAAIRPDSPDLDVQLACTEPLDLARVADAGARGWADDDRSRRVAERAWTLACREGKL